MTTVCDEKKNERVLGWGTHLGVMFFSLLFFSAMSGHCESASPNSAEEPINPDKIYAQAVESNRLWVAPNRKPEMLLITNDANDRVGARFSVCEVSSDDRRCDTLTFVFPQLTIDHKKKEIVMGEDSVAKLDTFFKGIKIYKPYRLGYEIETKVVDNGFDRYPTKHVKVYLEKAAPQKSGQ